MASGASVNCFMVTGKNLLGASVAVDARDGAIGCRALRACSVVGVTTERWWPEDMAKQ
jgi:hypothetical protein